MQYMDLSLCIKHLEATPDDKSTKNKIVDSYVYIIKLIKSNNGAREWYTYDS